MNPNLVGIRSQTNTMPLRSVGQKIVGQKNPVNFGNAGQNVGTVNVGTVKGKNLNAPDTEQLRQTMLQGLAPHLGEAMKRLTDSLSTNSMNYGKPLNNETFAAGQIVTSMAQLLDRG